MKQMNKLAFLIIITNSISGCGRYRVSGTSHDSNKNYSDSRLDYGTEKKLVPFNLQDEKECPSCCWSYERTCEAVVKNKIVTFTSQGKTLKIEKYSGKIKYRNDNEIIVGITEHFSVTGPRLQIVGVEEKANEVRVIYDICSSGRYGLALSCRLSCAKIGKTEKDIVFERIRHSDKWFYNRNCPK